jgi:hypothetical protein
MLRISVGKVVHTVKRAWTYAAKVAPQELREIAVHVLGGCAYTTTWLVRVTQSLPVAMSKQVF